MNNKGANREEEAKNQPKGPRDWTICCVPKE